MVLRSMRGKRLAPEDRSRAAVQRGGTMHVSVRRESPEVIRVELSGRLKSQEWYAALGDVSGLLTPGERTSVLVAAEGFEGWESGDWGDLSFQQKHDPQIRRIAIVTREQW